MNQVLKMVFIFTIFFSHYAAADTPTTPERYIQSLKVGINVNWAMWKNEVRHFSAKTVRDFKSAGFDHIRIRFRMDFVERTGLSEEAYFAHLERIVTLVLQEGMRPILALGAEKFKREPTEANMEEAVEFWRVTAQKFHNVSHRLAFDLMIEPGKRIKRRADMLNRYYREALSAVRESNPDRIVFVAPPKLAQPASLDALEIFDEGDEYLTVETHFYAAGPSPTNPKKRWTTGTPEEKALLRKHLDTAIAWKEKNGIPFWIGAIMPGDYNHGDHYDIDEQVHFATYFSCLFRKYNVPFAINADQQFYNVPKHRWRKDRLPVLKAVIDPVCEE
jgi:hypothetical protein